MKKIISIMLTICLLLSVFACGKSEEETKSDKVKIGGMTYSTEAVDYVKDIINIANKYIDGSMESKEASDRIDTIYNSLKKTTGANDSVLQISAMTLSYAFTTLVKDEINGSIVGGVYTEGDYEAIKKALDNLSKAIEQ